MSGILQPRAALTLLASLCALALLASAMLLLKDKQKAAPEPTLLEYYNRHPQELRALPVGESPGDPMGQPPTWSGVESAALIGVVKVVGLEFEPPREFGSPTTQVTYEVVDPIRGLTSQQRFREWVVGGPFQSPTGEVRYLTSPRWSPAYPGDLLLVFMTAPGSMAGRFLVDPNGNIVDDIDAQSAGISGKPVADLRAAVSN